MNTIGGVSSVVRPRNGLKYLHSTQLPCHSVVRKMLELGSGLCTFCSQVFRTDKNSNHHHDFGHKDKEHKDKEHRHREDKGKDMAKSRKWKNALNFNSDLNDPWIKVCSCLGLGKPSFVKNC